VIVSLDDEPIQDAGELTTRLARHQPGERVALEVVRDGRRLRIPVTLGQFETEQPETRVAGGRASPEELLGFSVTAVTPQLARQLEIEDDLQGVVVTGVNPYGPAAGVLRRGDVILAINRTPVESVRTLQRLARDIEAGEVVVLRIRSATTGNEAVRSFRVR
jgi:serine protease Do